LAESNVKPEFPKVICDPATGLIIEFTEFFGRDYDEYEFFSMSRKRNFLAMSEKSAHTLQELVKDPDFALGLLSLRFRISLPDGDPDAVGEADLPGELADLLDEQAVATITRLSDTEYAEAEVNIDTDHAGRNEELQFTNAHAQVVLRWSLACTAMAPLITTLMSERDIRVRTSMNLFMNSFCALLPAFEPEGVDILAKLRKLVESRVLQTRYSDKVMWNYLRNVATDPHIFVDRLFRRFVTEAMPKLMQGTNIIKFFQTFLKKQIMFKFKEKFNVSFKPVRTSVMDGEGVSAMEQLETELVRRDEGAVVLGETATAMVLRDMWKAYNYVPSTQEVNYWADALRHKGISSWQRSIVTKFFLPNIGRVELIRTRTLPEFVQMLLAVRTWCYHHDLAAVGDYIGSYAASDQLADGKRLMSRKKFVREFIESAQYQELLGRHFGLASQAIVDSGVVIDMISAVHCGTFYKISEFGEEDEGLVEVDHRIETVAQEVLRFIAHAACPRE
jgi:hypothetical protein